MSRDGNHRKESQRRARTTPQDAGRARQRTWRERENRQRTSGEARGSFNTEQLEKTATMLGMSLYQLMIKLLQPIDGINQIKP